MKTNKTNVILIGMPGTGKSTVGVVLAKRLCFDFVDTDLSLASKNKKSLPQLIKENGFDGFIKLEGEIGKELKVDKTVVATGGSMVFSEEAMANLKEIGVVVYLDTDIRVLEKRINSNMNDRGVVTDKPMTTREIYELRKPLYEKYAEITIDCHGTVDDNVLQIVDQLGRVGIKTRW
ncbi:MAG: shikimate kinase [Clostridia bacterium]